MFYSTFPFRPASRCQIATDSRIPPAKTPHLKGSWRAPSVEQPGTAQVNSWHGPWEIAWDDGINNSDFTSLLFCTKRTERVTAASCLPGSRWLLESLRANCPGRWMEQGSSWKCENTHRHAETRRIYNRKTHTVSHEGSTYNMHPLFLSGCICFLQRTAADELRTRNTTDSARPDSYS